MHKFFIYLLILIICLPVLAQSEDNNIYATEDTLLEELTVDNLPLSEEKEAILAEALTIGSLKGDQESVRWEGREGDLLFTRHLLGALDEDELTTRWVLSWIGWGIEGNYVTDAYGPSLISCPEGFDPQAEPTDRLGADAPDSPVFGFILPICPQAFERVSARGVAEISVIALHQSGFRDHQGALSEWILRDRLFFRDEFRMEINPTGLHRPDETQVTQYIRIIVQGKLDLRLLLFRPLEQG